MTGLDGAAEFVQSFIEHAEYDPVKAHEYYVRTRQLKGRQPAKAIPQTSPKTQAGYPGHPHKLGTRFEEDASPMASPTGAKLTSYSGGPHGLGKAVYADGHVYDAKFGWIKPQPGIQRANAAQSKLDRARKAAQDLPPQRRKEVEGRIKAAQDKLNAVKASTKSRANQ